MKIAISSTGEGLDAQVDPRFGRCQYFLLVDTETMEVESIDNQSAASMGGAGIQAAQTVANKGAEAVITGNVGPNAYETLTAAGISIYTGAQGKIIQEAIEALKDGTLSKATDATVKGHFGTSDRSS
jgi:predicted Fe-Mo cluster-binding NifX family protein